MASKTQIDRLGNRLRESSITEVDLRTLDEYRRSFGEAYEIVVGAIQAELGLQPTGRPAKSTTSISEKLIRESIRLTQIQVIAGCRLIVPGVIDQNDVVESLTRLFNDTTIVNRREKPSHGYRAVHVIVRVKNRLVEIQVRTSLQHVWAELSEKLSDVINPAIKYGGGNEPFVELLGTASELVAEEESGELLTASYKKRVSRLVERHGADSDKQEKLIALQQQIQDIEKDEVTLRERIFQELRSAVDNLPIKE